MSAHQQQLQQQQQTGGAVGTTSSVALAFAGTAPASRTGAQTVVRTVPQTGSIGNMKWNLTSTVFVGNLQWWTKDQFLINRCYELDVTDLKLVNIYEDRRNGKSKGYGVIECVSEASSHVLAERLGSKIVDATTGKTLAVAHATKTNIHDFSNTYGLQGSGGHHGGPRAGSDRSGSAMGMSGAGPRPPRTGGYTPRMPVPPHGMGGVPGSVPGAGAGYTQGAWPQMMAPPGTDMAWSMMQ
jgi:hypothetical protein